MVLSFQASVLRSKDAMGSSRYHTDRRKYPRVYMDLPLEYRMKYDLHARGGIVIDASEKGFLIYSTEDIPLGTKLKIAVLFPIEYELANVEVFAEIIWKKISVEMRGKRIHVWIESHPNVGRGPSETKKTSQSPI